MRRPFGTASVRVLFWKWARREPEDSTEESGRNHPDTESDEFRRELLCLLAWKGTVSGHYALCAGGVL